MSPLLALSLRSCYMHARIAFSHQHRVLGQVATALQSCSAAVPGAHRERLKNRLPGNTSGFTKS